MTNRENRPYGYYGYWAGENYKHKTYSDEILNKHMLLSEVFPYKAPLYAIISVENNCVDIKGTASTFVGETPSELNFQKEGLVDEIIPVISSRKIFFNNNGGKENA